VTPAGGAGFIGDRPRGAPPRVLFLFVMLFGLSLD
jgi:hypothetical protein